MLSITSKIAQRGADAWYDRAVELESSAPSEACAAYRRAISLNPRHADAHINLGRLMHEAGHTAKAARHYLQALWYQPRNATAAFNFGVALEDMGRVRQAVKAYQRCIASDAAFADAYYNLGTLLEKIDDRQCAICNLTKYKKLSEATRRKREH